ncbi:hypothetical protein ACGFIF_08890 [Kribbella sp. NPDC049174]|uniref:hypothetical protein n=1 Tax=Kribbella sp. NPDC049174 TaxID=3364112 RepID=UPI003712C531
MLAEPDPGGIDVSGYVIIGSTLAHSGYRLNLSGEVEPDSSFLDRIDGGGGYGDFVTFEESRYQEFTGSFGRRTATYGLRSDGVLFRWIPTSTGQRRTSSYPGFASVKTMALISKTRTYDTFLANTRGGALYTVHIPTTSPMKPVVKPVRTRTWQGFEFLIAQKCGIRGTLLLGIDKDTQSAYLYAVGHANGTATVIQGLGKVPGTFNDPVYFRWALPIDPLFGE